jgi:hypothetical protein
MEKALLLFAGGFVLTSAASAMSDEVLADERNYRVIIERNPFGLKPPPVAVTNVLTNAPPKDEILLTGYTTIGGPRAYFMTKAPPGKDPEKYSLGVDEKRAGLEVLEINPINGSVRVRNSGMETVMTLAANGVKAPASSPPGPATPGAVPGGVPPPPAGIPGIATPGATTPAAGGRIRTIPARNVRTPTTTASAALPTPGIGMTPAMAPNMPARPNPDAAVQDALLLELQRKANPHIEFPPTPGLPQ